MASAVKTGETLEAGAPQALFRACPTAGLTFDMGPTEIVF